MLEIKTLDDVRGNNVVVYSMKTLLDKDKFPHFSILSGHMGVGKSSVARLLATTINKSEVAPRIFNFGLDVNMVSLGEEVFSMNPASPKAFIFEELHGLDKAKQTALLTLLDSQPSNIYIICTTTESMKLLRPLRSRAQCWDFKLLGMKQMSQLLDDYLAGLNANLDLQSKQALLRSCHGVPRDLLKNTDFMLSGEFTATQLNELLGSISDDRMFTLLCALKTTSVDFANNISLFIDESSTVKVQQLRDFWTRFILENKGVDGATLPKEMIKTLASLYTPEEVEKIGRTLIKATNDTLALELILLNMTLTRTTSSNVVGQQRDKRAIEEVEVATSVAANGASKEKARLTAGSLRGMKLE